MKKNDPIHSSKDRAKTVQFRNSDTGERENWTFFGTEFEVSQQIDDFMQQNPNLSYVQSFAGILGKLAKIAVVVGFFIGVGYLLF